MYDVSALAVSTPQTPAAIARRSGASDDPAATGSFGDLVDQAGRNTSGRGSRDQDEDKGMDAADEGSAEDTDLRKVVTPSDASRMAKVHGKPAFDPDEAELDLMAQVETSGDVPVDAKSQLPAQNDQELIKRLRIAQIHHRTVKADQVAGTDAKTETLTATPDADVKLLAKQQQETTTIPRGDEKRTAFDELNVLLGVASDHEAEGAAEAVDDKHLRASSKRASNTDAKDDEKTTETPASSGRPAEKTHVSHQDSVLAVATAVGARMDGQTETTVEDTISPVAADRADSTARSVSKGLVTSEEPELDHHAALDGSKTDFVNVLDSRRYLGLSNDAGNANRLADAIRGDQTWVGRLSGADALSGNTATEVNTLKLQLNPEHLGSMTASLRLKGEELSVELRVDTIEAYRQLSGDQDSIVKALKDQGFSIDQVSVQLNPSAKTDSGQSGGQYPSDGGNQAQQGGGQGEGARQRDDSARRNSNQNNWTANDASSVPVEAPADRAAVASGNLYL